MNQGHSLFFRLGPCKLAFMHEARKEDFRELPQSPPPKVNCLLFQNWSCCFSAAGYVVGGGAAEGGVGGCSTNDLIRFLKNRIPWSLQYMLMWYICVCLCLFSGIGIR